MHFNWTQLIPGVGHHYIHVATVAVAVVLLMILGTLARYALGTGSTAATPAKSFGIKAIFESITEFVVAMSDMVIGKEGRKFVPMFSALFLFIFINNVFGFIPGWTPATDNMNTTLAAGLFLFIVYNAIGLKEHGPVGYYKHFHMFFDEIKKGAKGLPLFFFGFFILFVELISHGVRPFSLGLRLYANMVGDHAMLGAFYDIFAYLLPIPLMFLGLFVCFMQAFIFMLLGMIYISIATSHDH